MIFKRIYKPTATRSALIRKAIRHPQEKKSASGRYDSR